MISSKTVARFLRPTISNYVSSAHIDGATELIKLNARKGDLGKSECKKNIETLQLKLVELKHNFEANLGSFKSYISCFPLRTIK